MSSAVKVILGVSTLAMIAAFAGCDSSSDSTGGTAGGPIQIGTAGAGTATAGAPATGTAGAPATGTAGAPATGTAGAPATGTGGPPATGTAGSGSSTPGYDLTPVMGWIDGASNGAGIQGALFAAGDDVSHASTTSDFTTASACIKGTAAKVDLTCTPPAGGDCYGVTWGEEIGLNLNQPNVVDPDSGAAMGGDPINYDASMLSGFSFDVTGNTVPAGASFRFKVVHPTTADTSDSAPVTEYCNVPTKKVVLGTNTFLFTDLVKACYAITTDPPNEVATVGQNAIKQIAWQVVTNTQATVPFDFCISNIKALPK